MLEGWVGLKHQGLAMNQTPRWLATWREGVALKRQFKTKCFRKNKSGFLRHQCEEYSWDLSHIKLLQDTRGTFQTLNKSKIPFLWGFKNQGLHCRIALSLKKSQLTQLKLTWLFSCDFFHCINSWKYLQHVAYLFPVPQRERVSYLYHLIWWFGPHIKVSLTKTLAAELLLKA